MSQTTILIVEDEAIVAADLAGRLRQLGYEVVGMAATGEAAIALAGRFRPQLVLMDIWLQGPMDGIAVAEVIRREYDTPVVYLTAHSDAATLARAKLTGPFGYILKPFEERELATQIELALYKYQTDRQLREQREWLRVTLTSIGDAVIATDAAGQIAFVNLVAETLTGWTAQEVVGQPIQSVLRLVNEQTGEPLEECVTRVLREGHAVALANHASLLAKDGGAVPIEDSTAPIRDATGQVIGAVLVFHDVTEKRRAEEAMRRAKEDWEETFNTVPDCVAILDTQHRIVRANQAMATRSNKTPTQCVGVHCYEVMHGTSSPPEVCPHVQTCRNAQEHTVELEEPSWGGNFLVTTSPRFDARGNVVGTVHVARDITRLKETEKSLHLLNTDLERRVAEQTAEVRKSYDIVKAERQRFNDLLDTLPVYVVLLTPDYHVSFANHYFRDRFGESHGRRCFDHLFQRSEPCEECESPNVLRTGAPRRWEATLPDGHVYDIYGFPFTDTDGSSLVLEMGIDITDRRCAEEETRRMKEELAHVERAARMGELTASLAHEISQPLTAILSNAQAARRFVASPTPDMDLLREILDDIIRDDKRAGSVMHGLRVMLQKGKPELQALCVNDVVREVAQLLHSEFTGRNASLSLDLALPLPDVKVGRVDVHQVLVNLLVNALDSVKSQPPHRQEIVIRTSLDGQAVVVAVRDRGCGIRSPDVNSIFEPFFTTKSTGLGMGLAICRRIIQSHRGRIWATNNEDEGATVSFSLPSIHSGGESGNG